MSYDGKEIYVDVEMEGFDGGKFPLKNIINTILAFLTSIFNAFIR